MYAKIDIETIAASISNSWRCAQKQDDHKEWLRWWGIVEQNLYGSWCLVNYSDTLDREERDRLLEEISWLEELAHTLRYSFRRQAKAA